MTSFLISLYGLIAFGVLALAFGESKFYIIISIVV